MEPTAKVAMTSMLEAMMDNKDSTESESTSGSTAASPISSASFAIKLPPIDSTHRIKGLTHSRSLIRLMMNRNLSVFNIDGDLAIRMFFPVL